MCKKNPNNFNEIIEFAKRARMTTPETLPTLIKLLSRPQQHCLNLRAMEKNDSSPFTIGDFFDPTIEQYMRDKAKQISNEEVIVDLAYDVIFAWPWSKSRYLENLSYLSDNNVEWLQDYNHQVVLVMPWRVAFVECGNHSIFAGVVHGKGQVTPQKVVDATCLLSKFKTDGVDWIDIDSSKKIGKVTNYRNAAVFEIGRLLVS
ncbi:DUF6710 family protein [Vibrio splendidus]|uniref:DUF6710 family protein n=1 Tax=Vibrio splendidus TaxID=29497 RepID=UPI003D0BB8E6